MTTRRRILVLLACVLLALTCACAPRWHSKLGANSRQVALALGDPAEIPAERFDLDIAAALGKRDWDHVIKSGDKLSGAVRDRIHKDGAGWVAPLEFLSEVFIDGKPLTKSGFEQGATTLGDGVRTLDVHFPRFGPVTLLDVPGAGRFVTSLSTNHDQIAQLVRV